MDLLQTSIFPADKPGGFGGTSETTSNPAKTWHGCWIAQLLLGSQPLVGNVGICWSAAGWGGDEAAKGLYIGCLQGWGGARCCGRATKTVNPCNPLIGENGVGRASESILRRLLAQRRHQLF